MTECAPKRVFISYSHDSQEHEDRVLALSDQLRGDGIEAIIDQYEPNPPEGWPRWMEKQVDEADFVLAVCTPTYYQRMKGKEKPGVGKGVRWEGHLVYNGLYIGDTVNTKFIPVLLEGGDPDTIPDPMRGFTFYRLPGDYEKLYRHLTGQPLTPAPEIGKPKVLPPRSRISSNP